MKFTSAGVGVGRYENRARWAHVLLRLEADGQDDHELLAELAQYGARATVVRCAADSGLALAFRIDPIGTDDAARAAALRRERPVEGMVRPAAESDVPALARLWRQAFPEDDPETIAALASLDPSRPVMLFELGGRVEMALRDTGFRTSAVLADIEFAESVRALEAFRALSDATLDCYGPDGEREMRVAFPYRLRGFAEELHRLGAIGERAIQVHEVIFARAGQMALA